MKAKNFIFPLLLSSLLVITTACGTMKEPETESESGGTEISTNAQFKAEDYKQVVQGNNELGFKLLRTVQADEYGNIVISPTSLLMAMSMVHNGADGVTKEEIAKALQVEGIEVDQLNKSNASLLSQLDESDVQLDIANSIWLSDTFHFQKDFVQHNKNYFNAKIEEINIPDVASVDRINDWVKEATSGKIEDIAESPLDPNFVAILVNAIYFKGNWTYPFHPEKTEQHPFHLTDGAMMDVSLMTLQEELSYMENDSFQAVQLPYGEKDIQMTVYLPKEEISLEAFKEHFSMENWTAWQNEFRPQEGTVMLPKFQLEYEVILKDALQQLGLQSAFDENRADFSKMIEEKKPVWISEVKQKTFIDVNEEGTEAAAATSIEMKTTSAPMEEPFQMKVNRPFFITISDNKTEAILFLGEIAKPLEK